MSKSLPPSRRHGHSTLVTPPETPPSLDRHPLGILTAADHGPSEHADTGSLARTNSTAGTSSVDGLSASDMESHLAAIEGLGPPGATRNPQRRVRSIERTWAWVKSRSSVYGEAAFSSLATTMEDAPPTGLQPLDEPGPSRPLTVATDSPHGLGPTNLTKDERRRRRQGLIPESRATSQRPKPVSDTLAPIDTSQATLAGPSRVRNNSSTTPLSSVSAPGRTEFPKTNSSKPPPLPSTTQTQSWSRNSAASKEVRRRHREATPPRSLSTPTRPASTPPKVPPTPQRSISSSASKGTATPSPTPKAARQRPPPTPSHAREGGLTPSRSTPAVPTLRTTATPSPRPRPAIQSIDDIVKRHSNAVLLAQEVATDKARAELWARPDFLNQRLPSSNTIPSSLDKVPSGTGHRRAPSRVSHTSVDTSDTDSVFRLARAAVDQFTPMAPPSPTQSPAISTSAPPRQAYPVRPGGVTSPSPSTRSPSTTTGRSRGSPDIDHGGKRPSTSNGHHKSASPSPADDDAQAMALYLRSPHLNKIMLLHRPYPERPLQVSLADLGKPDGRPVLVFLGLGCVRYLVALYDELARALGLRLICIDRWGLGKTDQVPQQNRRLLDWAEVVRRVLDELGVETFQILAHSAGAPYALACVLKMEKRVRGKIHLLSPWVGGDVDGYKWLKWVPNGVIKSAIAAEWRLESYFLGKAPMLKQPKNGHSAQAKSPVASTSSFDSDPDGRRSRSSFTETRHVLGVDATDNEGFDPFAMHDMASALPPASSSPRMSSAESVAASVSSSPGFPQALMQASHAEALSGMTADLLSVVLGRDAKPWGFSYTDIHHPCKIWYGAHDDRVSEKSMRWMERAMDAELTVLPDEGHNLMSSRVVMFDVLDSLADERL